MMTDYLEEGQVLGSRLFAGSQSDKLPCGRRRSKTLHSVDARQFVRWLW